MNSSDHDHNSSVGSSDATTGPQLSSGGVMRGGASMSSSSSYPGLMGQMQRGSIASASQLGAQGLANPAMTGSGVGGFEYPSYFQFSPPSQQLQQLQAYEQQLLQPQSYSLEQNYIAGMSSVPINRSVSLGGASAPRGLLFNSSLIESRTPSSQLDHGVQNPFPVVKQGTDRLYHDGLLAMRRQMLSSDVGFDSDQNFTGGLMRLEGEFPGRAASVAASFSSSPSSLVSLLQRDNRAQSLASADEFSASLLNGFHHGVASGSLDISRSDSLSAGNTINVNSSTNVSSSSFTLPISLSHPVSLELQPQQQLASTAAVAGAGRLTGGKRDSSQLGGLPVPPSPLDSVGVSFEDQDAIAGAASLSMLNMYPFPSSSSFASRGRVLIEKMFLIGFMDAETPAYLVRSLEGSAESMYTEAQQCRDGCGLDKIRDAVPKDPAVQAVFDLKYSQITVENKDIFWTYCCAFLIFFYEHRTHKPFEIQRIHAEGRLYRFLMRYPEFLPCSTVQVHRLLTFSLCMTLAIEAFGNGNNMGCLVELVTRMTESREVALHCNTSGGGLKNYGKLTKVSTEKCRKLIYQRESGIEPRRRIVVSSRSKQSSSPSVGGDDSTSAGDSGSVAPPPLGSTDESGGSPRKGGSGRSSKESGSDRDEDDDEASVTHGAEKP